MAMVTIMIIQINMVIGVKVLVIHSCGYYLDSLMVIITIMFWTDIAELILWFLWQLQIWLCL